MYPILHSMMDDMMFDSDPAHKRLPEPLPWPENVKEFEEKVLKLSEEERHIVVFGFPNEGQGPKYDKWLKKNNLEDVNEFLNEVFDGEYFEGFYKM